MFVASFVPAGAKNEETALAPQAEGVYELPGHKDLLVQALIHKKNKSDQASALVCTADPDSAYIISKAGWKLTLGTWKYYFADGSVPPAVGGANLAAMTQASLGVWSAALIDKVLGRQSGIWYSVGAEFKVKSRPAAKPPAFIFYLTSN